MSFAFATEGNKTDVLKALYASTGYGDTSHHDALRDAAKAIVNTIPNTRADKTHITVSAHGHHDFSDNVYGDATLTVTIVTVP